MKLPTLWIGLLACALANMAHANKVIVYVSERGENRLVCYQLSEADGELKRISETGLPGSPGSLAVGHGGTRLHAAIRTTKQFATLKIDPDTGSLSDLTLAPAGFNAAYISPDRSGKWLLSASYSEGVVGVSKIVDGIVVGEPVQLIETGKKAHCILTSPDNRFAFVPHVGELNKLEQFRFNAGAGRLQSNVPPQMPGGEGQGPRHMQFHPNGKWLYLVNEQGMSVSLCDYDAETGLAKLRQTWSTVPTDWDPTQGTSADIHLSADGRFVYASNRGHDSLATFAISDNDGSLTPLGQTATEKTPRSFCLTPGDAFVISAGEGSDSLIVYQRNAATGKLTPLKSYPCGKGPAWVTSLRL
jgi:6-phosphogluconolactonase